ncbi:MAG TPA: DUF4169 family protein [Bauldia sp.]|nr:DUF4169 family protein [Bauldia sp.]
MAADIVNLRRARKERDRAAREEEAAANRRRFGRTRAEKEKEAAERDQAARLIDGHRREPKAD